MAAVFDLDLETEEGSEGEGEPDFSPAVSVAVTRTLGSPGIRHSEGALRLHAPPLSHPDLCQARTPAPAPAPRPTRDSQPFPASLLLASPLLPRP